MGIAAPRHVRGPSAGGLPWWAVDGFASYEGSSGFLRWWPKVLLAVALGVLVAGGMSAVQWSVFCVLAAWIGGHFIPWRFGVFDAGVGLLFPFGRRMFLPKDKVTVRLETVGAVALIEGHRRLGYLLHDGVLYVPDQQSRLRHALNYFGYRVV